MSFVFVVFVFVVVVVAVAVAVAVACCCCCCCCCCFSTLSASKARTAARAPRESSFSMWGGPEDSTGSLNTIYVFHCFSMWQSSSLYWMCSFHSYRQMQAQACLSRFSSTTTAETNLTRPWKLPLFIERKPSNVQANPNCLMHMALKGRNYFA